MAFNLFLQPNMWVQLISTMDQWWITDVLLAPPLPTLAAPDDLLLELTHTPEKERQHKNRERKGERIGDVDYWVLTKEEWCMFLFSVSVRFVSLRRSTVLFELWYFFWKNEVVCHDWLADDVNLNITFWRNWACKKNKMHSRTIKVTFSKFRGWRCKKTNRAAKCGLRTALRVVVTFGGSH